ncbi:MAG: cardiolipin synthase B, partial [Ilumatobacter sp.]|nr:cardiolipin synthase B [Ilumatobacter sp.]
MTSAERHAAARVWADRMHSILGTPATAGNSVTVLRNGNEIFAAMLAAIDGAARSVDLVTFVYWNGHVADRFAMALAAAAHRGCRVRVLLDALGGRKLDPDLLAVMTGAGCDVQWFRPLSDERVPQLNRANNRTHRKILVCDGEVGFIGGVGIADEWDGDARNEDEYRDTHLAVRGPAVADLQAGFLENWTAQNSDRLDPMAELVVAPPPVGESRCIVIRGVAETGSTEIWRMMLTLITCATERIRIASAYFNPGVRLSDELIAAVERGVSVDIMLPGEHADKRFIQIAGEASYGRLLDAGVTIRTYEVSMMHAKVMTVDGTVAS